jgi:hypothetical protein
MSKIPGTKKLNKFSKEVRGSFGRFKTDNSYQIHYLSTNVPVEEVDGLSTASELFNTEKIEFDELIQRDIDHSRVRKIANDYLSKGHGRVIFFPPLLACVLLLDDEGNLIKQYSEITQSELEDEEVGPVLRTTWNEDGFQLDLPEADADSSDRKLNWKGGDRYFYDFAAMLRLNPKRAKLVVLDGQHRLEAIRLLRKNPEQQSILEGLELPICIIWAPEALATQAPDESMAKDFRELFVRVNSEPRKVSGHFIILLRDDSYSAMAVRSLADYWKKLDNDGWSRLHLLEWNTREDERVDVRTRDFSITTVSIIDRVLEDHLFSQGTAPSLLQLEDHAEAFGEADPDFSWDGLTDRTQNPKVDEIVKRCIEERLTPALDIILRTPSPYERLESSLGQAYEKLQKKTDDNNGSFLGLKKSLNSYIYKEDEIFEESARAAYVDFKGWLMLDAADRLYFFSVFQQGLLRFWLNMAILLKPYNVDASLAATAAVAGLEKLVFSTKDRYLNSDNKYTRRTLWRNENVNFTSAWAKNAWSDLIGTSVLRQAVRTAIIAAIADFKPLAEEAKSELDQVLKDVGTQYAQRYCERLLEELKKETKLALSDFFNEELVSQLRAQKGSAKLEDRQAFEKTVKQKAEERFRDSINELAEKLQVKTESLLRNVDAN